MLEAINFSLSSLCSADCIYCPARRGARIGTKVMPLETARNIIDQAASPGFAGKHKLRSLSFGENGDAFLNPNLIPILRYAREKLPGLGIYLFTNFWNFTEEKARVILGEGLVDYVLCNVDGSTPEGYKLVKRLDLAVVTANIDSFLRVRKETGSKATLQILVLTYPQYVKAIRKQFGVDPVKMKAGDGKGIKDEFREIRRQWYPKLDRPGDKLTRISAMGWAERESVDPASVDYRRSSCINLRRVMHEAFIAPDGTWYACCYDADNELALGNAAQEGLDAVYEGLVRRELIAHLQKKEFGMIAGPCRTVNCCGTIHDYLAESLLEKVVGGAAVASLKKTKAYLALRRMVKLQSR